MSTYRTLSNRQINILDEIGRGGEGAVFSISGISEYAAKIYYPDICTDDLEKKLRIMVKNPPADDTRSQKPPHISITWPVDLVYKNGKFAGYIMPYIKKCPDLYKAFNPLLRSVYYPSFNWAYLHRTARNISAALNALHSKGYVIGDINQKNILVTDRAMVTFIDVDSLQVPCGNGQMYRCYVGVPDYTPPELHGVPIDRVNRTVFHDYFGLAVIIFQLLMEGFHPFSGTPRDPSLSIHAELFLQCIIQGIFPYYPNNRFNPPPHAPRFEILYPELQSLFVRAFIDGYTCPHLRPTAYEWIVALDSAEKNLKKCTHDSSHRYSAHYGACHWCNKKRRPGKKTSQQKSLTIIKKTITVKGISFNICFIPPGKFMMGSPTGESPFRSRDEKRHRVIISRGFWMMETPVTRYLYTAVMGYDPSRLLLHQTMRYPVINVSWLDAVRFCTRLSTLSGMDCRLPSEAQWEYACRAGTITPYSWGNCLDHTMANYAKDPGGHDWHQIYSPDSIAATGVGSYRPNALGLYDMHGNVWEWCNDWYGNYVSRSRIDPRGPSGPKGTEKLRVIRGGSWQSPVHELRSACRRSSLQEYGNHATGFRAVFTDI